MKRFYGTSENRVNIQLWGAVSVQLLVANIHEQVRVETSLHTMLQVLSATPFERMDPGQAGSECRRAPKSEASSRQLPLFAR